MSHQIKTICNGTYFSFITAGPKPVKSISVKDIKGTTATVDWTYPDNVHLDNFLLVLNESATKPDTKTELLKNTTRTYVFENLSPNTGFHIRIYAVDKGKKVTTSSAKTHGFRTGTG